MDIFTFASQFTDWQRLVLFVLALAAMGLFFTAYNYVRSSRLRADNNSAIDKMKAEVDGKIETARVEADKQIELARIELERSRQERERLSMTIQDERDKRDDKTINRLADTLDALKQSTEASNRVMTGIYTKQDEDKEVRDANVKRLIDLQLTNTSLLLKLEDTLRAVGEVKVATESALEAHRVELEKTNARIGDVFQNTRHILDKINALGIVSAQLKKELLEVGRVDKIDEIGRLTIEVMQIVRGMDEQMKRIRKGTGTLDPSKAPAPIDPADLPPSVASVITSKTFADPNIGSIPKRNTDKLAPLPPTEPPVAPVVPLLTPPDKHDTAQLKVTTTEPPHA